MHALLDVNCGHGSIELKIVKKEVSKKSKMLNFQSEIIHQFEDRKAAEQCFTAHKIC